MEEVWGKTEKDKQAHYTKKRKEKEKKKRKWNKTKQKFF